MLISTEAQLLMAVVLFYIYDSCQLLFSNEGVITKHRKRYTATIDKNGLLLMGKRLYIPNLLLPYKPIYKLSWNPEDIAQAPSFDWDSEKPLYLWFIFPAYGMALSLFVITPAVYYLSGLDKDLLWCLVLIYYFSIVVGVGLYLYRKPLGLSNKKALSVFLECLFCPPLAMNIVRKLSLLRPMQDNFAQSAFQLLEQEQWEELRNDLIAYIDGEIEETDAEDKIARLNQSKEQLLGMNK
ncbi:hypothetical protein KVP10_12365 [Candidimonas humi]|uniref:Uncharacterized protein n=1 Tax=Candidimonas humi TaxID=683355 RepID=A0ABV8NZW1_9BURK|nr:hypothetical protein [Candidimonas humi]MBV6305683.1 hypothetical protein [Candidimonas humi]